MSTLSDVQPSPIIDDIERFLRDAIQDLQPDEREARRAGPGRPRILPSLCLWGALLVCVLHGFSGQRAIWRLLSHSTFWFYPRFPVSDQAVYKRLASEGLPAMQTLFGQISMVLRERLAPFAQMHLAPFATEVMDLDETTLDGIGRLLPLLRDVPPGDRRLLGGKLAGLFDVRRQQWHSVRYIANAKQNEKVAARDMLQDLPAGSLVLADLGYFSFPWFDHLTSSGYHWISRLRAKTSYKVRHVYYQRGDVLDAVVWLGEYRADRARCTVRLVCFTVGTTMYRYITNVLDPTVLTIHEIAALYARRWDFELAVKMIKRHLNLHLLWSAKDVVIQIQIMAVLIIAQILQALRMEIAGRAGVDPFDVSMQLLVEYAPQYAYQGESVIDVFVEQGRELLFIRPSTRRVIRAPTIPPECITPLPPGFPCEHKARYAQRL